MLEKTLNRIVSKVVQMTSPEKIILFGSLISGRQNVYSDIDLFIIANDLHNRKIIVQQIHSFIEELALKSDIFIFDEKEIEQAKLAPFSFVGSVLKKGKIIYKK